METATLSPQRLGNLLVDKGYLAPDDLRCALERQKQEGRTKLLGEILVELEYCAGDHVVECLAAEYGVPYVKLDSRLFDPKIADILPREWVEQNLAMPLFLVRGVLTVAVSEPSNLFLIDEIRSLTNSQVQIVAASQRDIRRMIAMLPSSKMFVINDDGEDSEAANIALIDAAIEAIGKIDGSDDLSPVVQLVNYIITSAVREGASDIHIEPSERCMRVRYRIDGRLHSTLETPQHLHAAIANRIKTMSAMDMSERRLPQDGRIHVLLEGHKIDLCVTTFPATHGEKIVLRILDARSVSLNLENLGFAEDVLDTFQSNIRVPNGIVLVVGPTGSGKTTTLYAALNAVSSIENNVCTIEDPIERHLPLVNQFQVRTRIGVTFSKAVQTLMRQDPDIIMVGDIRDRETAQTTVQAALTGRLVFGSLYTNDACSSISRLINMGVEPYMIAATLNMILAQRLVRRVCSKCRTLYEPARVVRRILERMGHDLPEFQKGVGCADCHNTGFKGRIAIHESLVVNDEMRDSIVADSSIANLRKIAARAGMVTLARDGFRKVREGLTTPEEIIHIIGNGGDEDAVVVS